ncbi:flavin-containing monooxygenase [Bradyrhizobium sp. USDA 3315]
MMHATFDTVSTRAAAAPAGEVDLLVVGAGFAGMLAAIEARRRGITNVLIIDKGSDFGGCWRENTYPGIACDIPSHLYSFRRNPNADWSRTYSPGAEIFAYSQNVAREEGLYARTLFGKTMTSADWNPQTRRWEVRTAEGDLFLARALASATGPLHQVKRPDIPGLESFAGAAFHSAQWRHDIDLTGKRIVVIGTGASAIQFVPEIAKVAGRLTVIQRSAPYVIPRHDRVLPAWLKWAYRHIPGARALRRTIHYYLDVEMKKGIFTHTGLLHRFAAKEALRNLRKAITDPILLAKLTPNYEIGCKRVLVSDDWYPALARPNVAVETAGVAEVRADRVALRDGTEIPADVIVFGTGFHVADALMRLPVRGRDGRTLGEAWQARDGSVGAYFGGAVPGFPNFFLVHGPRTGSGWISALLMIESQVEHLTRVLTEAWNKGTDAIEPNEAAYTALTAELDERVQKMVWSQGGCASWYLDGHGRNRLTWPGSHTDFDRRNRAAGLERYCRAT